tara:strand:- start:582 stop:1379 length:798 start_codon:yes stop_codon:yes gene_type:complete
MSKLSDSMDGRSLSALKKDIDWSNLEYPVGGSYHDDTYHQALQNDMIHMANKCKDTQELARVITTYLEERESIIDHHYDNGRLPPLNRFAKKDLTRADVCAKMYVQMMIMLQEAWSKLEKVGVKDGPNNKEGIRIQIADLHFDHIGLAVEFPKDTPVELRKAVSAEMDKGGDDYHSVQLDPKHMGKLGDRDYMVKEMEKMIDSLTANDIDQAKMMMKTMLHAIDGKPVNKLLEKVGLEMEEEKIVRANFDDLEVDVHLPDELPKA